MMFLALNHRYSAKPEKMRAQIEAPDLPAARKIACALFTPKRGRDVSVTAVVMPPQTLAVSTVSLRVTP